MKKTKLRYVKNGSYFIHANTLFIKSSAIMTEDGNFQVFRVNGWHLWKLEPEAEVEVPN